jgi:hypothetical protein
MPKCPRCKHIRTQAKCSWHTGAHFGGTDLQGVGAACYTQTPAYGVYPPLFECYSSTERKSILLDISGVSINVLRQKPEIVTSGGGDTTFSHPRSDYNNDGLRDGMEFAAGYDPLSAASFPVWGDINDDRVVDTADVLLASRAVMGLVTLTDAERTRGKVAPLVNGAPQPAANDPLTAADLLLIERKALGEVTF